MCVCVSLIYTVPMRSMLEEKTLNPKAIHKLTNDEKYIGKSQSSR